MIYINEPTKLVIPKADLSDIQKDQLEGYLTYTNKSAQYNLSRFKKHSAHWYDEDKLEEKLAELKADTKKCLLFEDGDNYWTYTGLKESIQSLLRCDMSVKLTYPLPSPLPWSISPKYGLRSFQEEALELLLNVKHGGVE